MVSQSYADTIMADLVAKGFTFGSITDRERARLSVVKNHVINPSPVDAVGWTSAAGAILSYTAGDSPGIGRITVACDGLSNSQGMYQTIYTLYGNDVLFSAKLRWISGPKNMVIWSRFNPNTQDNTVPIVLTSEWTTYYVLAKALLQTTSIGLFLRFLGTSAAMTFEAANLLLTPSLSVISYFDGNTPSDANFDYAWEGSPNNSASTKTVKSAEKRSLKELYALNGENPRLV